MENVPSVTIAYPTQQLKCKPLLFDVFQKGPGTHAIVEGAIQVLSNKKSVGFGLDDSLVRKGIRDVCQGFPFS